VLKRTLEKFWIWWLELIRRERPLLCILGEALSGNANQVEETERRFVEAFKSSFSDFPQGNILKGEQPDFVIINEQRKIGFEVTRIYQANVKGKRPQKEIESERRAVVYEALRNYEKKGLPPIDVSIHFGSNPFNKKNRNSYASALADFVAANIPPENSWLTFENNYENPDVLPYEFHSVRIARYSFMAKNHWFDPDAGWMKEDFAFEIQQALSKKESRLPFFRKDCIAHWLLIVAEGFSPSSFFDPSEKTLSQQYESSFDRAFFLELFTRKSLELKLIKPNRVA